VITEPAKTFSRVFRGYDPAAVDAYIEVLIIKQRLLLDDVERLRAGLKESGAVYLNGIGGAAQFYARCIDRVTGVSLMQFGTPEAMWHLEVKDFPAVVTMDSHGRSLHQEVADASKSRLAGVLS